jgi:MFS family permease
MAAFSLGWSAKLVMLWGNKLPLAGGLLLAAVGLVLFGRAPVAGQFVADVLPGMVLLGLGAGIAFNPMLLVAMSDVEPSQSGLASGIVNTSFMMGGALGLAALASAAAAMTSSLMGSGVEAAAALNAGYQLAFNLGAAFAAVAGFIGFALLKKTVKPER